jgi:hypothetical protein
MVDTDLVLPQLSPRDWTLRIDGMVERELEIGFGQLLRMPLTEAEITLVCVSNEVGGTYNGNARWLGVPLAGLLRRAGVRAGADQVLSSAADGMTISTPLAAIMGRPGVGARAGGRDERPAAAGGDGFRPACSFPALRLRVRDRRVTRLTVTTFAARRAHWTRATPRRHRSRPSPGSTCPGRLAGREAGRTTVAGVAWATPPGHRRGRGRVDDGAWAAAVARPGRPGHLAAVGVRWDAAPGLHPRGGTTGNTGATQTPRRAHPFPSRRQRLGPVVVTVT